MFAFSKLSLLVVYLSIVSLLVLALETLGYDSAASDVRLLLELHKYH